MDLALVIKHRLKELGLEQRGLAAAAHVTESYISQLLGGKKAPPAPERTAVYAKMETLLSFPHGELARLAGLQRQENLKRKIAHPARPLFQAFRELILRKCTAACAARIRETFEVEPFGDVERLVTQTVLDVAKKTARDESGAARWLQKVARLKGQSLGQARAMILEFLEMDIYHVSIDSCVSFLDPLIESCEIDLETFSVEITLNRRLAQTHRRRFEFAEQITRPRAPQPALESFLADPLLGGDISPEEVEFLRSVTMPEGRRPTPLYYYRELQNLRDPLHFEQ